MYRILQLLTDAEIAECRRIAARAALRRRADHQPAQHRQAERAAARAAGLSEELAAAAPGVTRSEEFRDFAFPVMIAPPLLTRYKPGMKYGAHADAAFLRLPQGDDPQRPQLHDLPQRSRRNMRAASSTSSLGDADLQLQAASPARRSSILPTRCMRSSR